MDTWLPGGGLPRGALSEFCGVPTCGLTTFALQVTAHTQAAGRRVLWLDLTGTFDPFAASKHHVDLSALILVRPRDKPEALSLLDELVAGRAARLLVVSGTASLQEGADSPTAWEAAQHRLTYAARRSGRTLLPGTSDRAQLRGADTDERGIPWLGFVVYPTHRRLKARNAVAFTRCFAAAIARYEAGRSSFAELDASVQGWLNHARYADTWGLRRHLCASHPINVPRR